MKSCNLKCHQHAFSSWHWGIMNVTPLKRTAVQSTLPFPSGSRRVLEQIHRSCVAVKSLLCALFLNCFLSVRPASSASEEFSVFFSKTEKNAARVPLQPPTRQTSPSQMLIFVWTHGTALIPYCCKEIWGDPLVPSPSPACHHHHQLLSCRSDRAPKAQSLVLGYFFGLQGCSFLTHACRFPVTWLHSHLSEFCQCTLCAAGPHCLCQSPCRPEEAPRMLGTPCVFTGVSL